MFAKDRRKLNRVYNRKLKKIQQQKVRVQREQERKRDAQVKGRNLYWDPMRPMKEKKKKTVEPQKKEKQKADVFGGCSSASYGLFGNYG